MPDTELGTQQHVAGVLDGWQDAIARGRPDEVATFFTDDALFQGLRPTHSIGREAVADYYGSQRAGLSADYTILRFQRLADDRILSYQRVAFSAPEHPVTNTHLTTVLQRVGETWLISHYHVSRTE
jgi:uncharacterized protein (TIGR02246 family)